MKIPRRIYLLRVLQERVPRRWYYSSIHSAFRWRWYHLASLRRFLKFWIKHKFGVDVEVTSEVFPAYGVDIDAKHLSVISKQHKKHDLIIFILDKAWWKHKSGLEGEGIYSGDWIAVKHSRSTDYTYLATTAYRCSHELLHAFGDKLGWPRKIWAGKVDRQDMRKKYIGWGRFNIIGYLRRGEPFKIASGMPRYVTQGGDYG